MATYAIGDLQGCDREFTALLDKLDFSDQDQLWLVGDLINRGPESLQLLRRVMSMQEQCVIVDELAHWLRCQKLLHVDEALGHMMVHAGVPHIWDITYAQTLAREVERVIAGRDETVTYETFFQQMYGNEPALWDDQDRAQGLLKERTQLQKTVDAIGRGEGRTPA